VRLPLPGRRPCAVPPHRVSPPPRVPADPRRALPSAVWPADRLVVVLLPHCYLAGARPAG